MDFWVYVGIIAGIYAIFALGLYLQFGLTGMPNFGHVAFMAIASYTMAILVIRFKLDLWLASVVGIALAIIFGVILAVPAIRLRAAYLSIATVAGGEIIRYLAMNMTFLTGGSEGSIGMLGENQLTEFATQWTTLQSGLEDWLQSFLGDWVTPDFTMLCLVTLIAIVCFTFFGIMAGSPWARVLKSIREDETACEAVGKGVFWPKLQVLILGAFLGAVAGLLLAFEVQVFDPTDFIPTLTFYGYLIIILGGITRLIAIPVGAILFGLLYSGTRFLNFFPLSLISSSERPYLRLIIIGLALVALMAFRPQGMFGNKREVLID